MKRPDPIQAEKPAPSLFQVAAHLESFAAANPKALSALNQKMPFADLMLHPEKVEAVLETAEIENQVAVRRPLKKASRPSARKLNKKRVLSAAVSAKSTRRVANLKKNKIKDKKGKL